MSVCRRCESHAASRDDYDSFAQTEVALTPEVYASLSIFTLNCNAMDMDGLYIRCAFFKRIIRRMMMADTYVDRRDSPATRGARAMIILRRAGRARRDALLCDRRHIYDAATEGPSMIDPLAFLVIAGTDACREAARSVLPPKTSFSSAPSKFPPYAGTREDILLPGRRA